MKTAALGSGTGSSEAMAQADSESAGADFFSVSDFRGLCGIALNYGKKLSVFVD